MYLTFCVAVYAVLISQSTIVFVTSSLVPFILSNASVVSNSLILPLISFGYNFPVLVTPEPPPLTVIVGVCVYPLPV